MSLIVDVHKDLGGFRLDVGFRVDDPRETLALLGPSGCGKSMTLKCIAGIVTPDEGHVELNGRVLFDSASRVNLPPQRRRVGYLFQQYALFPNMTVEGNVMTGASGATRDERRRRAAEQIAAFQLEGLERLRPSQLSGGQQQRVALARILAGNPELLLLDEPFSALDGYLRWQIELELGDTLRAFPGGSVFVSHNRDEVYRMCDTVCVVTEGHSEPKLTIDELFATPSSLSAALISGCKNVSRATVSGPGRLACADWGVTLATTLPTDHVTHAGIRAHYFEVARSLDADELAVLLVPEGAASVAPAAPAPAPAEKNHEAENVIPCAVDRVIDSTFSTIVMLRTPGGGLLRYELEKDAWAALAEGGVPAGLAMRVDPSIVMPLSDSTGVAR